jgi:hypothetical protein
VRANEMETTIKKVVQGKTIASAQVERGRCKLIFEDLTFVEFYAEVPLTIPYGNPGYPRFSSILAVRWGKEKNENRASN